MADIFQGDLRLTLDENGASMEFIGGQPVMDQGLENQAIIALFTSPGWAGNALFVSQDQKIESDFEEATRQALTLTALNDIRDAAEKALESPVFGTVTVEVTNPKANRLNVLINIQPPGQDIKTLLVTRNGLNWTAQAINPAHRRLTNGA